MLNWLTSNCELFGLPGQNWMLVVGGGLLLYIAVLVDQPAAGKRASASAGHRARSCAAQLHFEREIRAAGVRDCAACGNAALRL